MLFTQNKIVKKMVSLGLSATLIYNATVPALGQDFSFKKLPDIVPQEMVADGVLLRDVIDRKIQEEVMDEYFAPKDLVEERRAKKNSVYARALEIKYSILGDPKDEIFQNAKEFCDKNGIKKLTVKEKYLKKLTEEYEATKAKIEAEYNSALKNLESQVNTALADGQLSATMIEQKKKEKLAELNTAYNNDLKSLDNYYKQEISKADKIEAELEKEWANNPDAFYNFVKPLIAELFELYQKDPEQVKDHILELTSIIVSLVNQKGEHLYTEDQIGILNKLYTKVIEKEKSDAEIKTPWGKRMVNKYILNQGNREDFLDINTCKRKGYCPYLTSAFLGLSSLPDRGQQHKNANLILETMNTFHDTAANVPVLTSGFSALLVMKEYGLANHFLKERMRREPNKVESAWDALDYLNFMYAAESIVNINGKYHGNSSMYGQYEDEDGNIQNSYFDLAQILAADGSKEALSILRKQGVERCLVKQTSGVNRGTLAKYTISCSGIMPFLVGSLMSGKSGADEYNLPLPVRPERYKFVNGKMIEANIPDSPEEKAIKTANRNYRDLAATKFNGDAEAMIALHVMMEAMGDLDDRSEYAVDSMLYKAFGKNIPQELLHSKYLIIDQDRQDRKYNRHVGRAVFIAIGMAADVILTIMCFTSLAKLGGTILSIGRGAFNAFKIAKVGVTFKQLSTLSEFAHNFKTAFMASEAIAPRVAKMTKFVRNYKSAVSWAVQGEAIKYTSMVDTHARNVLSVARQGADATPNLAKVVKLMTYDETVDAFKFAKGVGKYPQNVAVEVQGIYDNALMGAREKMRFAKLFKQDADFSRVFLTEIDKAVANSHFSAVDQQALLKYFRSKTFKPVLNVTTKNANLIKKSGFRNFSENPLVLGTFLGTEKKPLGVKFVIEDKIPAFSEKVPEFATITGQGDNVLLKFLGSSGETIDLSSFKLALGDSESVKNLIRISKQLGPSAKLELKFIPTEADNFWFRNFKSVFGSKEKLFGGKGKVFVVENGVEKATGITLRTYKKYDGVKILLQEGVEGGLLTAVKNGETLPVTLKGSMYLPKYQLSNLVPFAESPFLKKPLNIKLLGGKNKINALYFQSVVSLSAASTGLVGPLRKNYPEMKTEELALISLVFPYLLSALTPFVSPLVKRYGAIKVLKTSMGLSLASLAIPITAGFTGLGGIQSDNPFEKPSPYFLYPSALLIGLATTLTRGSYSPLIQSIGGGSGTLKAVAFKSISGFVMILPPVLGAAIDEWKPKYFTNPDGSLYLNEDGKPVQKHWFDFSFSYPVILGVSATSLYLLQKNHFNPKIGKELGYSIGGAKGFFKEAGSSYGILFSKEMRPLTISSALLAGAESSLLYSYSTSKSNEYVRNEIKTESLVPVVAMLGIGVPAFFTRINSKPYLKLVGGDNLIGYRNMTTVSLAFAGTGGYLMMKKDDPVSFTTGMALTSIGFAQLTSSILRYGHVKLAKELKMPSRVVTSWDVSYPTVFFGMSAVPYVYGAAADKSIEGIDIKDKDDMISLKNTASKNSLGIPVGTVALGGLLAFKGMTPAKTFRFGNHGFLGGAGFFAEMNNPMYRRLMFPTSPTKAPLFVPMEQLNQPNFQPNWYQDFQMSDYTVIPFK